MKTEVKLPEIGEGVSEGELVSWLVKEGESVDIDQPIAELMTDKATVEVPSSVSGVIKEFKFNSGDTVEVGQTLVVLDEKSSQASSAAASQASSKKPSSPPPQETSSPSTAQTIVAPATGASADIQRANGSSLVMPPAADLKVLATPSTRRLARELGVDINNIAGTGLAGRVTRDDILSTQKNGATNFAGSGAASTVQASTVQASTVNQMVASPKTFKQMPPSSYHGSSHGPSQSVEERIPMRGIRRKIAENMQKAKAIIPHFTLCDEVDVTELFSLRNQMKEEAAEYGVKVTYLPFVMKALISTMREFPMFNASIDDESEEIVYKKYYNIAFAADTPNGLVVPVIKDADRKTLLEISKEIVDLAHLARENKLTIDQMRGATITITNIGSVGGLSATPVINHPEVAILGMYKIVDRPVIVDGQLSSIKSMNFTITADHRLIDGAVAANFLMSFFKRIKKPGHLILDMV